jgi:hypothetical protein
MAKLIVPQREAYTVTLGGKTTTDDIVQAWRKKHVYVDPKITQDNFPLAPHDCQEVEVEVIDPSGAFSEYRGLKCLASAGLERPTYEHALRFAEQWGRTAKGKGSFVVFLHEISPILQFDPCIITIDRIPRSRGLYLFFPQCGFDATCVVAGVRPHMQSAVMK